MGVNQLNRSVFHLFQTGRIRGWLAVVFAPGTTLDLALWPQAPRHPPCCSEGIPSVLVPGRPWERRSAARVPLPLRGTDEPQVQAHIEHPARRHECGRGTCTAPTRAGSGFTGSREAIQPSPGPGRSTVRVESVTLAVSRKVTRCGALQDHSLLPHKRRSNTPGLTSITDALAV